ncbi:hypothetical protein LZ32DRAFT_54137 [Colletotrichum eremochloae]|nr:hypothetical protein LZ32DRAFT_54137 [Colletotrichum eremochloae]
MHGTSHETKSHVKVWAPMTSRCTNREFSGTHFFLLFFSVSLPLLLIRLRSLQSSPLPISSPALLQPLVASIDHQSNPSPRFQPWSHSQPPINHPGICPQIPILPRTDPFADQWKATNSVPG